LGPISESKRLNEASNDDKLGQFVFSIDLVPKSPPESQFVTLYDSLYLQYFVEKRCRSAATLLQVNGGFIGFQVIPAEGIELLWSSQSVRWAALAYASFQKAGDLPNQYTFVYLGHCYKQIRNAISTSVRIDLVYACYMLIKIALAMDESMETIHSHLVGMYKILNFHRSVPLIMKEWEWEWMEGIWLDSLKSLIKSSDKLRFEDPISFAIHIEIMADVLEISSLRELPLTNFQLIEQTYWIATWFLIYIEHHFMRYLLLINDILEDRMGLTGIETTTNNLHRIIHQLMEFLPRHNDRLLDNFRILVQYLHPYFQIMRLPIKLSIFDIHSLSFYTITKLLHEIIAFGECRQDPSIAQLLATVLCQVSAAHQLSDFDDVMVNIQNLFFAGMVLTRSRHPQGSS
jgi:hypothetical protein